MSYKVSKISVNPSRKVNLGNYSTADLNAGIEIVFDTPVGIDSRELLEAFQKAREVVKKEMKKQYEPYQEILGKNKSVSKKKFMEYVNSNGIV